MADLRRRARLGASYSLHSRQRDSQETPGWLDGRWRWPVVVSLALIVVTSLLAAGWLLGAGGRSGRSPPDVELPRPPSTSQLRKFRRAAVSSDAPICARVARDTLSAGGSAVDGAIAGLFCNGLVNMQSMGLGGGFIMTVYTATSGLVESLIAREAAPAAASHRMFIQDPTLSKAGALAVGVPGELRGYHEAWSRYGKLPWSRLVEPALEICRSGFALSQSLYNVLFFRPQLIYDDKNLRDMFVDPTTGRFWPVGRKVRPDRICQTLEVVRREGGEAIHNGSLTSLLVEDMRALGGIITKEDLHNYRAEWREPVSVTLRGGLKVHSAPPPASGPLLTFILSVLNGYNLTKPRGVDEEILTTHRVIEAFKFAFARRSQLADPLFLDVRELTSWLSSAEYGEKTRQLIDDRRTYSDPKHYGAVFHQDGSAGTSHISVISPAGDAVSVTSSLNLYFGAGVTSQRTGIILNDVMDDFSIPGSKNHFELPVSPYNLVEAGKRPLSSACPTVVTRPDGQLLLVLGAAGGTKIITAISWVIIRMLWLKENIKEALDGGRLHHQLAPDEVSYEYGVLKSLIEGLEKLGHKTKRYGMRSVVCALAKEGDWIFGSKDFRKEGEVVGFPPPQPTTNILPGANSPQPPTSDATNSPPFDATDSPASDATNSFPPPPPSDATNSSPPPPPSDATNSSPPSPPSDATNSSQSEATNS